MNKAMKQFFSLASPLIASNAVFAQARPPSSHVTNTFQFTLQAPLHSAAPMFGPNGERCWAGKHWNPEFVYPNPGSDVQGAVFRVQHGEHRSVWVNTVFDLAGGRMQYVALIPDMVVSTIDVRLTALDPSTTNVRVTYARTALDPDVNEDVEAMGKDDRDSGPAWQRDIEACLRGQTGLLQK